MGVVELGGDADLTQEALAAQHGRKLWTEHLERDLTVVLEVVGEIDRSHPTATKLTLDGVAVGEGSLETFEEVGHCGNRAGSEH